MKRILVPTDFSEVADCALATAVQLAERSKAEIILLHAIEVLVTPDISQVGHKPLPVYPFDSELQIKELQGAISEHMMEMVKEYSMVSISPIVRVGNPYGSITQSLNENDVDLIVMGSKGMAGLPEHLLGSNAERVVRHATCPVLTIKAPTDVNDIRDIVFATGLKEHSPYMIEHLKALQELLDAHLHLLHVNTHFNTVKSIEVEETLERLAEEWGLSNYVCKSIDAANVEFGIHFYAQEEGTDMVAMATHSRLNTWQLISGSIAEDITNHSVRPVWTCSFYKR